MLSCAINFLHLEIGLNAATYFFNPPIPDQHIAFLNASFIHDLYILNQVILHNLKLYLSSTKTNCCSPLLIMQYILKTLTRLCCIIVPIFGFAQSDMIPRGSNQDILLQRLEIRLRDNNELNYSTVKPISRKLAVQVCEMSDSLHHFYPYDYYYNLSAVDRYN